MRKPIRQLSRFAKLITATTLSTAAYGQALTAEAPPSKDREDAPVSADEQRSDKADSPAGEASADIVVTGSRLRSGGFTAPSPVSILGAAEIATQAPGSIAEVVNQIPSFRQTVGPAQSQRLSTPAAQNSLDLRGLGTSRTLMLIDGKRQATPDTNVLPVLLIDRVEVVTGGASAAYGSDAVAGVVNFIINSRLDGLRASVQNGISSRGDSQHRVVALAAGHSFVGGRLHVVAGVDYDDNRGVGTIYSRGWGREQPGLVALGTSRPAGTAAQGFFSDVTYSAMSAGGVITAGPLKNIAFGPGGIPFQFQQGSVFSNVMVGGYNPGHNPSGNIAIETPNRRIASLGRITFDVGRKFSLYAEAAYAHTHADALTSFLQIPSIIVQRNNPYLPPSVAASMLTNNLATVTIGRTLNELGGYKNDVNRATWRGAAGFNATLFGDFELSGFYQRARSRTLIHNRTNLISSLIMQAAYVVPGPTGEAVCGPIASNPNLSAAARDQIAMLQQLNPSAICAPLNIFGVGSPSKDSLDYISGDGVRHFVETVNTLDVAGFNLVGSPFSVWGGPVQVAANLEYRREQLRNSGDEYSRRNVWTSGNAAFYSGSQSVKEGAIELGVPLLRNSALGHAFDINAAVRLTDYSLSGRVTTWKLGATYQPIRALLFRLTRSRDIRAPNLIELFQAPTVAISNSVNPLNGRTGQLNVSVNGNRALEPEIAATWTGGATLQLPLGSAGELRASLDYYRISVDGAIGSNTPAQILQGCAAGLQVFCDQIDFDNSVYGIRLLRQQPLNLNKFKTSGLDFEIDYRLPMASLGLPGSFHARGLMTYVDKLETTDIAGTVNRAGSVQSSGVPKLSSTLYLSYLLSRFTSTLIFRHFSAPVYDAALKDPSDPGYVSTSPNTIVNNRLPARLYMDLSLQYDVVDDGNMKVQMFGAVDNLLDKQPPSRAFLINSGGNPYDLIGRTFKVGVRLTL